MAGSNAATGGLDGGATGVQLQQLVNSGDSDENSSPSSHPQDKYGLMGLLDVIKMTDRVLFPCIVYFVASLIFLLCTEGFKHPSARN